MLPPGRIGRSRTKPDRDTIPARMTQEARGKPLTTTAMARKVEGPSSHTGIPIVTRSGEHRGAMMSRGRDQASHAPREECAAPPRTMARGIRNVEEQ